MRNMLPLVMLALFAASCKKEPVMPAEPVIELVSISTSQVTAFGEPVTIRFSYADGNGDLGRTDPDDHSLWVKDSRLNTADGYHIQPLAPLDSEVPIQGELSVVLTPLFLLGSSGQEVMTYTFYVEDRAGQRSNSITTGSITIVADTL